MSDVRLCGWTTIGTYAAVFAAAWVLVLDRLPAGTGLRPAVLIIGIATPATLFGRLASGVLTGLQDVRFLAAVTLIGDVLAVALTLGLVLAGVGPVGLAVGIATPWVVLGIAAAVRLIRREPDLILRLPRASLRGSGAVFWDAFGTWLGGVGGRLTLGSNGLLLTLGGASPEVVVVFACTAKLVDMLNQQAWQVTDSGLIGLAQVCGSGNAARVRELTGLMARLAMVMGGGAALVILAVNPAFVGAWLGWDKFSGPDVNVAFAALVVVLTLVHSQAASAAILGRRLTAGVVSAAYGVAYAGAAVGLGRALGPVGVPAAGALVGLGAGMGMFGWLVEAQSGTAVGGVARDLVGQWLPRAAVPLALAAVLGASAVGRSLAVAGSGAAVLGTVYLWACRPLFADLPLPAQLRAWAQRLRLLPRPAVAERVA